MNLYKFKDFDSFFDALLDTEKKICGQVRELIQANFPHLREKFGYGVPYYHQHSRVCFMYPASFPYSGQASGVALGFTRGHMLSNEQGLLDLGGRKEVAYVHLQSPGDIKEELLLEILHEAVLLDTDLHRNRRKPRS